VEVMDFSELDKTPFLPSQTDQASSRNVFRQLNLLRIVTYSQILRHGRV
jgi:hypothetical protein